LQKKKEKGDYVLTREQGASRGSVFSDMSAICATQREKGMGDEKKAPKRFSERGKEDENRAKSIG